MTVADLIEELRRYPPHLPVYVERVCTGQDGMPAETVLMPVECTTTGGAPYGVIIQGDE